MSEHLGNIEAKATPDLPHIQKAVLDRFYELQERHDNISAEVLGAIRTAVAFGMCDRHSILDAVRKSKGAITGPSNQAGN